MGQEFEQKKVKKKVIERGDMFMKKPQNLLEHQDFFYDFPLDHIKYMKYKILGHLLPFLRVSQLICTFPPPDHVGLIKKQIIT